MADAKLKALVIADTSQLERAFRRAQNSTHRFSRAMGFVGTALKGAAFAAGTALVGGLVIGTRELMKTETASAQTAAAIKSTGGAANVTAKQVTDLANAISEKTGIDDIAVQSAQNLLLTFTQVSNKVGKGNDIFNQATKAITDVSVAFGKDLNSSAVMVGKALNDPIKGVSALTRVGIQFTDQQKAQIKEMVKAGNVMGAQKLILAELNKQVGGSAVAFGETTQGKIQRFREQLENLSMKIADKLLPTFIKMLDWVMANWPQISATIDKAATNIEAAFNKISKWWEKNGPWIKKIVNDVFTFIVAAMDWLGPKINMVIGWLGTLSVAFEQKMAAMRNTVALGISMIMGWWDDLKWNVNVVASAIASYMVGIEQAVAGLRNTISYYFKKIYSYFSNLWSQAKKYIQPIIDLFTSLARRVSNFSLPGLGRGSGVSASFGLQANQGISSGLRTATANNAGMGTTFSGNTFIVQVPDGKASTFVSELQGLTRSARLRGAI